MKSIIFIIFFTISNSCHSKNQKYEVNFKSKIQLDTMKQNYIKKFDIDLFEKNVKANSSFEGYTNKENVEISQIMLIDNQNSSTNNIVKKYIQTELHNDRFEDVFVFDKTGNLREYSRYFSEVETGIWKTYSIDGKILKEVNKDEHYPFSVKDVIDFSKKHKGNLSKNGSLKRAFDEKLQKHVYETEWIVEEPEKSYTKAFILDGASGGIIKEYEKSVPWIGR